MNLKLLIAFCLLTVVFLIAGFVAGQEGQTIGLRGLTVPLEYYPDGSIKAVLKAEVSTVDSSGNKIKAEGLVYETFTEAGKTDVVVTAEECFYDKAKGTAKSESRVKMVKGEVEITGKGFDMDAGKGMISLHSEVVVTFSRTLNAKEKK